MLKNSLKFFLTLLVSNWIYSEIVLFFPGFDTFCRKIVYLTAIPTHDKWKDIAKSKRADELKAVLARDYPTFFPILSDYKLIEDKGSTLATSLSADPYNKREYVREDEFFQKMGKKYKL